MAAAAVDVGYLAASYSVPASTFQSLLSEPTVELVQSLLVQLEAKARSYDDLKSEKLRSDLELENTVRSNESRQKALKATADKALKELEELRNKLAEQESAREQLEAELQNLKSTASTSSTEVDTLEARVKSLEAQNRDAIALHEAKSAAHDRLAEELSTQHQKLVNVRKQLSELEEKNQTLENAATSAKYREQNLQREIESLKKSNDWYEGELSTRTADNTKFRKEKNAQISELQRNLADATQTIESVRRTESTQRQRIEELEQKIEQSLARIQQVQDEATQKQQSFQAEIDNMRRLAALHQESANTAKAHVQQLREQLETVNANAAHELGVLQAENDSERTQREAAEARIAELESQIEGLEAHISELSQPSQVPMTPRRAGLGGSFETPVRAGSPAVFSPGSARSRGGLSTTQLYAENTQLKKELRVTKDKAAKLEATVEEMLKELEDNIPQIDEQKRENDHLKAEFASVVELLDGATKEREMAKKEARKAQGDYQGVVREKEVMQQQLRDLSIQITMLLLQHQLREQGMDSLSEEEARQIQEYSKSGLTPAEFINDSTDTGRFITERLVLFSDIQKLQDQNQLLISRLRVLGEQLEGTEAMEKTKAIERDREELARLRDHVAHDEEKIKSLELRSQSLTKERDMYRRIVTSRGQVAGGSEATLGRSVNGGATTTPPPGNMPSEIDQTPVSKEIAGYEKLIKDLQTHLDILRQESATDLANLKQQVDRLAKENNQLQGDKMRLDSALQLANERFELQVQKLGLLQSENNEIRKRCDTLQDLAAKQDIKTQQVAEDLLEARSLVESLNRENANLKASRDISKSTETRLQNENATLMEERSRLNKMISDLQNLRNEQELTESENRRRLQSRAESLESELQTLKRKLEDAVEDHKRATLIQESEQLKARNTIDDLRKAINNMRPELASTKTERDHLQARVDELKAELRIAEERSQTLQPRPTARVNAIEEAGEEGLSREEQLSIEISNLRHALEATQEEVESAKTDAARYQSIAQDVEEQMEGQMEAQEQLQQEMDRIIAEKDATINDLEKRVEEISSELAATNTELSELRSAQSEESALFTQRKEQLEAEINRLREESDRYKQTAEFHQEDLKAQAEIATRAQQNYENELVKHSDAMKNLQKEREEHNQLKSEVAQYKTQAEAARTALAESEDHWTETRERYERELSESRARLNDLNEQNKILHQQLESVSAQISALKQNRQPPTNGETDSGLSDTSGLQELVNYIRKEKEILEVQYEISLTDNKKLEGSVKSLQTQLDQTRELLSAAQQSQAQAQQSVVSLDAYQRNVEQMNTLRESNITLRNEARQAVARLETKAKEVEDLYAQLQPLQERVQVLEVDLESTKSELESAKQNGEHWQKRCQDVLHKYDRIDPAELEALNEKINSLQSEREQLAKSLKGAEEQIIKFDERLSSEIEAAKAAQEASFQERREKMIAQFKERSRELSGKIKEKDAAIQSLTQERDAALQELEQVGEELQKTIAARDEALGRAANASADTLMGEEGQVDEGLASEERQVLEDRVKAAEDRANGESNRAVALHIENQGKETKIRELENQIGELQQRIVGLNNELSQSQEQVRQYTTQVQQLQTQLSTNAPAQITEAQQTTIGPSDELAQTIEAKNQAEERIRQLEAQIQELEAQRQAAGPSSADVEQLKEELSASQKELEDLRTRVQISESSAVVGEKGEATESVSAQIAQQVAVIKEDLEAKHEERSSAAERDADERARQAEEKAKARTESMKEKLNAKIKQIRQEHQEAIDKLQAEHETALAELRQQLQAGTAAPSTTIGDVTALTKEQVQSIVKDNEHAQVIIRNTVRSQFASKEQKMKEEHVREMEELKQQHAKVVEELVAKAATAPTGISPEELERQLEQAKAKVKEEQTKMNSAKISLIQNRGAKFKAQADAVAKAAEETPERPVGEVWEEAKHAKPPPTQPAAVPATPGATQQTPTKPPTPSQAPQPGQNGQPQAGTPGTPQPNGTTPGTIGQPGMAQSPFGQPSPFGAGGYPTQNMGNQAYGQGMPQNRMQMPNQIPQTYGGPSGIMAPGFMGGPMQPQPGMRPESPFGPGQQQMPQQGGRGRGHENVGTGPAALRSLVGQSQGQAGTQSNIPRPGGGGIPRPTGRGQGAQQGQPQAGTPGAGGSQVGRGGGRGGRGGRGGQQQSNAPGGTLNPNAPGFQPGGGRGQKRTREDGGDGEGHQGGKRPRGGGGRGAA